MQLHRDSSVTTSTGNESEGSSPHHQFSLRSSMDLPRNLQFDAGIRYVDGLPTRQVNSYVVADLRLAWRPVKNLEVEVVGLNLLDNQHAEFSPSIISSQRTEVQHSVYGKITWRF
jgi:iron complex outermembrane receptor protein